MCRPLVFLMGTDSPVKRDSLSSACPSIQVQSAGTCCPAERSRISSTTIFSIGIVVGSPLRMTRAVGEDNIVNLSILRFALISCTIPKTILQRKIMTKKNCVSGALAISRAMTTKRHNRVKKVQILPKTILLYVLEYFLPFLL